MKYTFDEEIGIFVVEEEEIVELKDVQTWFETFEEVADELEEEDICLPFDEVIREDEEFLEEVIIKVNKRCNITNKNVSKIAIKEFIGDLTPINTLKGDNMYEYDYSIEIDDMNVLNLINTINNALDNIKEDSETLLDINDYNDNVIKGYINIGRLDTEFNDYVIVESVDETLNILGIEYNRHTIPNVDIGEYYFPITIFRNNINKLDANRDIEQSLNHIEYCSICKKEMEENNIMDNVIFDYDYDDYGIEEVDVMFEDEIGGDFYYTASGGAFDSASDYWNYILG